MAITYEDIKKRLKGVHDYHSYTVYAGSSDIASLTVRQPMEAGTLNLGTDGDYNIHIIDESIPVPNHYEQTYEADTWLRVYDDNTLMVYIVAPVIKVYQAGVQGILIQVSK